MDRQPVVAGQFYPGTPKALHAEVTRFLAAAGSKMADRTLLVMAPHAGYMYSGGVAGRTLGQANLPRTLLLLGPNHTGQGSPLALWPKGRWRFPGGGADTDEALAGELLAADTRISADTRAHMREHSLEVLLPFLYALDPAMRMAALAVGEQRLEVLLDVARHVAAAIRSHPEPVSLVVSSDMTHFLSHEQASAQDALALEHMNALDPEGLYRTVRRNNITMCGVLPMTLGLAVCRELGATRAKTTAYATSAEASGDYERVVGYAGLLVS